MHEIQCPDSGWAGLLGLLLGPIRHTGDRVGRTERSEPYFPACPCLRSPGLPLAGPRASDQARRRVGLSPDSPRVPDFSAYSRPLLVDCASLNAVSGPECPGERQPPGRWVASIYDGFYIVHLPYTYAISLHTIYGLMVFACLNAIHRYVVDCRGLTGSREPRYTRHSAPTAVPVSGTCQAVPCYSQPRPQVPSSVSRLCGQRTVQLLPSRLCML